MRPPPPAAGAADRSSPTPVLPHLSGFLGSSSSSSSQQQSHVAAGGHHPQRPPLPPKKRGGSLPASMMASLQSAANTRTRTQTQTQEQIEGAGRGAIVFLAKPLPSPLLDPPLAPSDAALPLAPPEKEAGTTPTAAAAVRLAAWLSQTKPKVRKPFLIPIIIIIDNIFNLKQLRDPMTEVALWGRALARLGMVSGTWATISTSTIEGDEEEEEGEADAGGGKEVNENNGCGFCGMWTGGCLICV